MRNTVNIVNVNVDAVTMQGAVERVKSFLEEDRPHIVCTPNAEIIMSAQRDPMVKKILNESDLVIADGAGVVLAARILGLNLPEKVSGVDLNRNLFALNDRLKARYFFFGGKPGVAEIASENIRKSYPSFELAGCRNGFFNSEDEKEIIEQINSSGADVLLVALGAPKQEKWIYEHRNELKPRVCIGVGGSLDIYAGTVKLAPEFMRRMGLEWLYRLCQEPKRYKRMLDLPRFVMAVLAVKLRVRKL